MLFRSHLILCRPLLLLPSIPPSIRVLSNESVLRMRWPKCWIKKSLSSSIRKERNVVAQSCPAFCDPVDCGPPGSSVHGVLQARILEWVAIPSPGELPNPEIKLASPVSPESPALQVDSLSLSHWGSPVLNMRQCYNVSLKYQLWFIKFIRKIIVYCIQISALSIDPSFLTL